MIKTLISIAILFSLCHCSAPLIGSVTSSGLTGAATGKYQHSIVSSGINVAVHQATGKTSGELLLQTMKGE